MNIGLQVLRAKIKGFQSAGESFTRKIGNSRGLRRQNLWQHKRNLGKYSREHFIAYGLLREIPYEKIERCAKENKPDLRKILELMLAHGNYSQTKNLTLEVLLTLTSVTQKEKFSTERSKRRAPVSKTSGASIPDSLMQPTSHNLEAHLSLQEKQVGG